MTDHTTQPATDPAAYFFDGPDPVPEGTPDARTYKDGVRDGYEAGLAQADPELVARVRRETAEQAYKDAANEVHIEARWQVEQQMRGMFANGERSIDRLVMLERILLDRAARIAREAGNG